MKLEEIRPKTYSATLTAHELSTLLAGARMALSVMEANPDRETERARESLQRVLSDFDSALEPLRGSR
jgi:signal transduction histidine kinase